MSVSLCDIVRGEVDRGGASVGNSLASHRALAFQTRYNPANYIGAGMADVRTSELQSLANTIQQKEWQLQARYGAGAPANLAWWRYGMCKTPASLTAQGIPYYDRQYLAAVAGYAPTPALALTPPDDDGNGGVLYSIVDTIVPDSVAARVPLITDSIAEPKLAVVLAALLILAFFATIMLVVYARKRAALKGLRRAATDGATQPRQQ